MKKKATEATAFGGMPARLWENFQKTHEKRDDERTRSLETLIGRPVPADLRAHGYPDSPSGTIFLPPVKDLVAPGVNAFEHILDTSDAGMPDSLRQIFSGCYYLTEIEGDGDCIFVYIPPDAAEETCLVTVWSHEEGMFTDPIAEDIPSFELAWSVSTGEQKKPKGLSDVKGRIFDRWPFNSDAFDGNAQLAKLFGRAPRKNAIRFLGSRAEWIVKLLHQGKELPAWLWPTQQLELDLKPMVDHADFPRRHATALYAIWRTFFLSEDEALRAVLARLEGTPSRLLADAAKTARELLGGRKKLGSIADVHDVRAWLSSTVKDPEKAQAAIKKAAREKRERELAKSLAGTGLVMKAVAGDPKPNGMNGSAGEWPLPNGGRLVLTWQGIDVFEPGKDTATRMPWPGKDVTGIAIAPDASHALISYGGMSGLFEVALPTGRPSHQRWHHDTYDVSYIAGGNVVTGSHHGNIVVLERRRDRIVPVARHETPGKAARVVLGGRVVVSCGGAPPTTFFAAHEGMLFEMLRAPVAIQAVAEQDGAVLVRLAADEWFEIGGLEDLWAKSRPKTMPPAIPDHPAYETIDADIATLEPEPTASERARFPKAIATLRRGGVTFAVVPEGDGHVLAWDFRGQIRTVALPKLADETDTWDDGSLDVAVSPSGTRAIFLRHDASTVDELDLATGKLGIQRSDDPRSGCVYSAGFITDDVYAWSHWQAHVHRCGDPTQVVGLEDVFSSIAGGRLSNGKFYFAGVKKADGYGDQELQVLELEGLDGDKAKWAWHKPYPLGQRLATLVRHEGDLLVVAGGEVRRFVPKPL